jgi:cysteine-S-conjugate beta-lyase
LASVGEREKTRLAHVSRRKPQWEVGTVNPPLVRCSTVLYRDIATRKQVRARRDAGERLFMYGASGTPTAFALEDAISEIEGARRRVLLPTGLAAIAHVFLSLLRPGDHVLLAETVYGPARAIAVNFLAQRGIACEFYPGGHNEVAKRLKPETRLVYLDNPDRSSTTSRTCLPWRGCWRAGPPCSPWTTPGAARAFIAP